MNEQELIYYTAGFFDGEGYCGFGYQGRREIRITNTNKDVLGIIKNCFGGNIYKRNNANRKFSKKDCYDLVIVAKLDVDFFIKNIYPHLIVKKGEMDRIIDGDLYVASY